MADQENLTPEVEANEAPIQEKKKGLPKGALIGIIAGGAVVLVAAIIFGLSFIFSTGAVNAFNSKDYKAAYEKVTFPLAALTANADSVQQIKFTYATKQLAAKEGKYYAASKILNDLEAEGYSKDKIAEAFTATGLDLCRVGNIATLATFEQDQDNSNGAEPLEWVVLDVKSDGKGSGMALIMTKNIIGTTKTWTADSNKKAGNWKYSESELAAWCEYDFYKTLIIDNAYVKKNALKVNITTTPIEGSTADCGEPTAVHSFALSYQEAQEFFKEGSPLAEFAKAEKTTAAQFKGLNANSYWLRNAGVKEGTVTAFAPDGLKDSVTFDKQYGIRPCMWVAVN